MSTRLPFGLTTIIGSLLIISIIVFIIFVAYESSSRLRNWYHRLDEDKVINYMFGFAFVLSVGYFIIRMIFNISY